MSSDFEFSRDIVGEDDARQAHARSIALLRETDTFILAAVMDDPDRGPIIHTAAPSNEMIVALALQVCHDLVLLATEAIGDGFADEEFGAMARSAIVPWQEAAAKMDFEP